jgi:hypothetical protein
MGVLKAVAGSVVAVVTLLSGAVALSSGTGPNCGTGTVDIDKISAADLTIAGFTGDQLVNAALIMNAATTLGLPAAAQPIGVMTAIGESSLRNIAYGDSLAGVTNPDGTPTSSLGLFQQQDWWGSTAQRMDPTRAATSFFAALAQVPNWETMTPTAAAHAVQANADPDHYTPYFAPAAEIVANLTAVAGGDCISADPVALAQELVTHADDGTLTGFVPDHIKEIRWIAHGQTVPDCGIDTRILQVMVIAVRNFERVGVSDINRLCTGQKSEGAGTTSSHYGNGGGHAVDFYSLDGVALTGADGLSLRLIGLLDPVMPAGARVGQSGCRAEAGTAVALENLTDFPDECTHLHVDVAFAGDRPLLSDQNP